MGGLSEVMAAHDETGLSEVVAAHDQINIFQQYGEANPSLLDVHRDATKTLAKTSVAELKGLMKVANINAVGCLEKSELVSRLVERTNMDSLCALWASRKCPAPKCVCSSSLQRVDGVERFRHCLGNEANALSDEELQFHLLHLQLQGEKVVFCDICDENVPLSKDSCVWTCENRCSTILHALSYDICDKCFVQRTCTAAAESKTMRY